MCHKSILKQHRPEWKGYSNRLQHYSWEGVYYKHGFRILPLLLVIWIIIADGHFEIDNWGQTNHWTSRFSYIFKNSQNVPLGFYFHFFSFDRLPSLQASLGPVIFVCYLGALDFIIPSSCFIVYGGHQTEMKYIGVDTYILFFVEDDVSTNIVTTKMW